MKLVMAKLASVCVAGAFLAAGVAMADDLSIPPGGVAQVTIAGGFLPSHVPYAHGVTIFEDGRVEHFDVWRDGRQERKIIARLTKNRIAAVKKEIQDLGASALVPAEPDAPMCADAPGTTYAAKNALGVEVDLRGEFDCRSYVRQDNAWTNTPTVLEGLERLAHL